MPDIPYGYCHCGCGEKTSLSKVNRRSAGHVKGQPVRFLYGHNSRAPSRYVEEDRGYKTPCWVWQGMPGSTGYPRINIGQRFYATHRVFYERHVGPIPEGLHLDHLCRVPMCVNPDHLEPVTLTENVRRGATPKLSLEAAEAIRRSDKTQKALAAEYGVGQSTIAAVRTGRTWR